MFKLLKKKEYEEMSNTINELVKIVNELVEIDKKRETQLQEIHNKLFPKYFNQ